jgi:stress response protein SCP2
MLGTEAMKQDPMYPNFPKQVMEASDAELYINALMHYIGDVVGLRITPQYEKLPRPVVKELNKLKVINLATDEDFHNIFKNLMKSNTSISAKDTDQLKDYIVEYKEEISLPDEIPHKEVKAVVFETILNCTDMKGSSVAKYFGTATDVLRLAVEMSGGDVSLAENTKFKNFKRKERRFLLELLDSLNVRQGAEDMTRHKAKWLRLGERLHPGEYKDRYSVAAKMFYELRNRKIVTYMGKLEKALVSKDVTSAVRMLQKRPGEFARRLDHVLRLGTAKERIETVEAFNNVAAKVSVPVLLQVKEHFNNRNNKSDLRVIFPKGNIGKVKALDNELPKLKKGVCKLIVKACEDALREHFSNRPILGKVFLSNELKEQIIPFSQRSASETLRTLVRGSRLSIPEGDTIRFFTHWKDIDKGDYNSRVDIDLSAVMYDSDWKYKEHISYTNLRSHNYKAAHSGDITSAPAGANEYIDLHIPSMVKYGARFVVMNLYSFTGQPFSEMPEAFAGWMIRKNPLANDIFDARTVENKIDLSADTKICIPVIFDLVERKFIWADLALRTNPNWHTPINVESNSRGVALMGKSIAELVKPNLYDLFKLHIEAREGVLIDSMEDADTVFSMTEGVTPFDVDVIVSDYL